MDNVEFKQGPLLSGWAIAAGVGLAAAGVAAVVMEFALTPAAAIGAVLFGVVGLILGLPRAEGAEAPARVPATASSADTQPALPGAAVYEAPAPLMATPAVSPLMAAHESAPVAEADIAIAAPVAPAPLTRATPEAALRPAGLDAARGGSADDLKAIKGVGPVLEQLLHNLGYYHFDQIAAWTPAEVTWVDDNLEGFKGRVTRDDWVAQARILASGGSTEHSRRVAEGEAPK